MLESMTVEEADAIKRPPIFVYGDDCLLHILRVLRKYKISSVAIISKGTEQLIGNISASDLKFFLNEYKRGIHSLQDMLTKPVSLFLSLLLSEDGLKRGRDRFPFFEVNSSTSVATTIKKLLATKTHMVWVVDSIEPLRLSGVISMTDIIKTLFKACPRDDTY